MGKLELKIKNMNKLKNFTLFIFSIVITIFLIEFAYSLYQVSSFKVNKSSSQGRSKFDEHKILKKNNKLITVATSPASLINERRLKNNLFPLSGISNRLTINCNENGYFSKYYSDRYGFNNKDDLWDKKVELLLIGDSYTHGACVNYLDTFAGNFNLKYNTISLGYGGNGPIIELGTIKEYINLINPKKIIWFFTEGNDLQDVIREFNHPLLKKYLTEKTFYQNLQKKQNLINEIQNNKIIKEFNRFDNNKDKFLNLDNYKLKDVLLLKNLKNLLRWNLKINFAKDKEINDDGLTLFNEVLIEANRVLTNYDIELFFVTIPVYPGVYRKDSEDFRNHQKIIDVFKKQKIKVISLKELMFDKSDDPKSFFPNRVSAHLTEYGYKIASEIILKNIHIN